MFLVNYLKNKKKLCGILLKCDQFKLNTCTRRKKLFNRNSNSNENHFKRWCKYNTLVDNICYLLSSFHTKIDAYSN